MIKVIPQLCAQGSYGLQRINQRTGQRQGQVIRVWHLTVDGKRAGTWLTRDEAREAGYALERRGVR